MSDQKELSLYERVVEVTEQYLGPAADRFVNRQITNHLNKKPEKLVKSDLNRLIDWMQLSFAIITDDDRVVSDYVNSLKELANNKTKRGRHAQRSAN